MAEIKVKLNLQREKGRGTMEVEHGPKIPVSGTVDEHGIAPYQMLLGSLGYCLFWTLRDIITKQKLEFGEIDVDVVGAKRNEDVATLEWGKVGFTIETDAANEVKIGKAVELAKKYCSVYQTLKNVAEIDVTYKLK